MAPTRLLLAALALALFSCDKDKGEEQPSTGDSTQLPGDGDPDDSEPQDSDPGDSDPTDSTDSGYGPVEPDESFERYCVETDWESSLVAGAIGDLHGDVVGSYNGLPEGTLEAREFVPDHPFQLTTLRLMFDRNDGEAILRLMTSFGRSYPDIDNEDADLFAPLQVIVTDDDLDQWMEIDVTHLGVFLHPFQHYYLVYEHMGSTPALTLNSIPDEHHYDSSLYYEGDWYGVGDDSGYYNYAMELGGQHFCQWDERWFAAQEKSAWGDTSSQRATIVDVDGDRDDDLVINSGGPLLYVNQGDGSFLAAETDPWPEADYMSIMVFSDLDNDGDVDAVGLSYDGGDSDGDGYMGGVDNPDCNDADAAVYPGAEEVDNGYDDDCDGVADDGTDKDDGDKDGFSEAQGDCDDTLDSVYPGAPEENDARDNDCDLVTDEDFANRAFLQGEDGLFAAIDCPDLQKSDPTGGAALGDADGDGALDLYYGNWLELYPYNASVKDRYLVGDGSGCFVDAAEESGIAERLEGTDLPSYGVVWADYNNDGHLDIYVSNYGYGDNLLWENQGDGSFVEVGEEKGVHIDKNTGMDNYGGNTFGADWGDIDNDGDLDLIATNIAHPRYQPWSDITQLLENGGSPDYVFDDVREELGVHYDEGDVNASFVDWDNDGDLDLMVSSLYTGHYSALYRNDGDVFTDVTYEAGTHVHNAVGNVWLDADGDGDMDVVVTDREDAPYVTLYFNQADTGNHWLELLLQGTTSNVSAVGARVTLESDGVTRIREVKGGGGHSGNQQSLLVHFGLGESSAIDSLTVRWPGGESESFAGLSADGRYLLVQGSGEGSAF